MSETVYLTKKDAAAACGCSEATIQRYHREGRLPNARYGASGKLEVPVPDLVAAGLLDPLAATSDVIEIAGRSRTERDLVTARQDLAVARAEVEACQRQLAAAREDITFLRSLLTKAAL